MKVIYRGESDPLELINGKEYDVISIECGWYRIVDETHDDYLFRRSCSIYPSRTRPLRSRSPKALSKLQ